MMRPVAVDDARSPRLLKIHRLNSVIDLDANDTDLDGDALERGTQAPSRLRPGWFSITIAADGSYTYTPAANFNGTDDRVDYTVTDGSPERTSVPSTITVTPVNDAPVAVDDAVTVAEDTPFVFRRRPRCQ